MAQDVARVRSMIYREDDIRDQNEGVHEAVQ